MTDLTGMITFARVAELESFSAAARELKLSKSAVSKQVSRLEDRLGLRLLKLAPQSLDLLPSDPRDGRILGTREGLETRKRQVLLATALVALGEWVGECAATDPFLKLLDLLALLATLAVSLLRDLVEHTVLLLRTLQRCIGLSLWFDVEDLRETRRMEKTTTA